LKDNHVILKLYWWFPGNFISKFMLS